MWLTRVLMRLRCHGTIQRRLDWHHKGRLTAESCAQLSPGGLLSWHSGHALSWHMEAPAAVLNSVRGRGMNARIAADLSRSADAWGRFLCSYRQFQSRQVAEAARRDERLQFELDTMAGEGLEVVMADRPADGARQVLPAILFYRELYPMKGQIH